MTILEDQLKNIAENFLVQYPDVAQKYLERANEDGPFTRDEGAQSHVCVYLLPFDPSTKRVFLTHHKKAGIWLSPGGHVDEGEDVFSAINREISEELGMESFYKEEPKPFFISITPINNPPVQPNCKEHFDVWFLVEINETDLNPDPSEYHTAKWMTLDEAKQILIDPANLKAMEILKELNK